MNQNDFRNSFIDNMKNIPSSSSIFERNIYRNDKRIDYICYVEGPTDPDFYENIKNTGLKNKNIRFIHSLTSYEGAEKNEIGKEGVIKNYNNLISNEELKKSIFIIDHDYEGLISEFYEKEDLNEEVFTITNGYSFENYFFTEENLIRIFNYFGLSKQEYEDFIEYLYRFVKEISYYNRLKSCTTIACKKCKYHTYLPSTKIFYRGKKIEPKDIFNFDFTNRYDYYYRKPLMEMQNKKIETVIKDSKIILEYFNKESIKFDNNILYIRGHDLYSFLQKYFYQKFNINISPYFIDRKDSKYLDIVKLLNVKLDLVNGLGEKIV